MAKISVIVPAYNVAPYLRECLDSVLVQDFENWECVVVDDESTDDSPRILDEYAAKDGRICVIHQKNKGEGGARNSGIAAAKGEWVFFLDGDDIMSPGALARLSQLIEGNPGEKLIRFGYERFQDGVRWTPPVQSCEVVRKNITVQMPMSDFYTYVWQHAYRRDVIQGVSFKAYKRGCDRVFVDEVLLNRVNSFVETAEVFYGYRMRAGSAMNSVPSTQVLKDEMWHRRDIVLMIEASEKRVEYAGSGWLEGCFTKYAVELIMQKDPQDRTGLWEAWIGCIDEMRQAKGLSRSARRIYNLCSRFRYRWFWWVLCRAWPWYDSHGIVPRGMRKMLRICRGRSVRK